MKAYVLCPTVHAIHTNATYDLIDPLKVLAEIIEKVSEPFIFNAGTLDNNFLNVYYRSCWTIHKAIHDILVAETGKTNIYEIAEIACDEDTAWEDERNKDLTGKFYFKFVFKTEYADKIKAAAETWYKNLNDIKAAMEAEKENERAEREARRTSLKCKILKQVKGSGGEGGIDPSALVRVTDPETGESLEFNCRNIFDFGYVINPNYAIAEGLKLGGLASGRGTWQEFDANKGGWYDVRELTEFEKRCLGYLYEFPPVCSGIRM